MEIRARRARRRQQRQAAAKPGSARREPSPARGVGATLLTAAEPYPLTLETGRRPFAIAIIVSFERRSSSVLTTQ